MPDNNAPRAQSAPTRTPATARGTIDPLTGQRNEPQPPNPNHPPPLWTFWLAGFVVVALAIAFWYWVRQGAIRVWQAFAAEIGGEFRAKNQISPAIVTGKIGERPFTLETALSHEDDAPYYHTCASMPIRNRASLVLGLRRKSLLEEAQTRKEKSPYDLEDPEFERLFFLVCNDSQNLPALLTAETRRELKRYSDVEIYIRLNQLEWRRAGEQRDLDAIRRLTHLLAGMADTVDALPARGRTLSERLADEELIAKGI